MKATATASFSRSLRTNPKIMKRWPSHVTTTHRATQETQDNKEN
jgi:hypothetical protein